MKEIELDPTIEFNKYRILIVIFVALFASIVAELLSYFLFFNKNGYLKLQDNLIKSKAKLDKLKLKDRTGIIAENSTISSNYSNLRLKKNPKVESLEQAIANINYKISMTKMKSSIFVGILFAAAIPLKNTFFGEMAVCKLPFEPIRILRIVTQAGLRNASIDDAGSIFIFGQAFMAFRMAIQKLVYFDASSSFAKV